MFLVLVTFITGFIMPIMCFVLPLILGENETIDRIVLACRIIAPSFCFGDSLYKMAFRELIGLLDGKIGDEAYSVWHEKIALRNF